MNKLKATFVLLVTTLFVSFGALAFGALPGAPMTMQATYDIEAFITDEDYYHVQGQLQECKDNETCVGVKLYNYWAQVFEDAGYSQVETYVNYLDWNYKIFTTPGAYNRQNVNLMNRWVKFFGGYMACVSDKPCKQLLIEHGVITAEKFDEIDKLGAKLEALHN
ncbi:hypothetical protein [Vibrio scophthalmi]|uniref:Uncharacterized protein n=1 Tax=Vibrio scophthalmi TaxID=45658 RepID=A0A1C7FHQ9_9VIBR|nr:hypothetical protein [Vibrio scophthalmi]ANU39500.1 hypothetical protein VSVS05_04465 [Vibrio scophthalmi]